MAENEGVTEVQSAEPATEPKAPEQDLEHWKSMSRKNERAAKDAARERDEANAKLADAQAKLAELEAARAKLAEFEAARAYDEAVRDVAEATGYPERVVRGLKGVTVEELTASAEVLKSSLSAYPPSRDAGEHAAVAKQTTAQQFAAALEGII